MKVVQSTCNYCAIDCNLDFHVQDGKIVSVVPTKGYPVNDGFACIKGISLDRQQTVNTTSPRPKVKQVDGSMKEVSWDEAMTHVADKITEIQKKYGKESVAGISTGQLTLEEFAIFGHMMRNHLQANLDGNTRLCMATAAVAHNQSFGYDAPGFTLRDYELSDRIILIGSNPVVAHPIIWDRIRTKSEVADKKLIVIDPRVSETAEHADYHYAIKGKSDLVLLYTVANELIKRDCLDKDFIAQSTNKFEEFKTFVKNFSLERGAEATGLEQKEILELVDLIATGKNVSMWFCMGVNQGYEAVRTAQAIINICLMTGNIGRPGTGPNSVTGQCNAMSSRLFSNTTCLFGGGGFDVQTRRERVADVLGVDPSYLAKGTTKPYNAIIEGINKGDIKALWITCTNPRHSWTNNETFRTAMEKLELFVVQDIYDTTETAEGATVFFPAVSGIRKEGTYINLERRLSPMRQVLPKPEDGLSDYEIFLGVAKKLGVQGLEKWQTPKDAFELMREMTRGMASDFTGVEWDDLTDSKGIQWPFPEGTQLVEDQRRLYENGKFFTPNGRANFVFEAPMANPLPTTDAFPYILNTGRGSVGQWHTQTRTKEIAHVEDVRAREAYVLIHPKLAQQVGVTEGEKVKIYSINGEDAVFIARLTDKQPLEEIYAPIHYIECNKLTPSVYDPHSKEPSYKATPIRVEKA